MYQLLVTCVPVKVVTFISYSGHLYQLEWSPVPVSVVIPVTIVHLSIPVVIVQRITASDVHLMIKAEIWNTL